MQNWFKKLKETLNHKRNPRRAPAMGGMAGVPLWTPRRYEQLAEEGYCRNVIVYRAVSLIARNLASVPWRLEEGENRLDSHPLLRLMQDPNPRQTGVSFLESLASYLLLAGNAYVELVAPQREGMQLYLLRPDRVQVVPEDQGHHYLYTVEGHRRILRQGEGDNIAPLLHLKMFHPIHDWYGMSALEAAASSIDQHNEVGNHNLAIMQNGGRPSGALILNNKDQEELSEQERQGFQQDLQRLFQGPHNAGRMLFLEGDMRWQEMGVSPKDLDFVEGKYLSAREIAQAYGVPSMLVGVPGDATFSNYKEARLHLWEDTILPLLDKIMSEVNRWLCPLYGKDLRFSYDVESIPALVVRRESLWSRMEACSFLSDAEKREALGYGKRE